MEMSGLWVEWSLGRMVVGLSGCGVERLQGCLVVVGLWLTWNE